MTVTKSTIHAGATVPGPSECKPGKPCGMLTLALDETDRLAPKRGGAQGLERVINLTTGALTVGYRSGRKAMIVALTFCPWCGKRVRK